MSGAEFDELLGRIRGLLVTLLGTMSPAESAEVDALLDHAELGESLRTLAWLIVEEQKRIGRSEVNEIFALAQHMGIVHEMPSELAMHVIDES